MTHRPRPNPVKKHRQHHVWQEYLRAWSVGGRLYCLMDGRIFPTGTAELAVEREFYKIGKLTDDDIKLIRLLLIDVKGKHPQVRKLHDEFLKLVISPSLFEGSEPALDDLIDTFHTNALEDIHAEIEGAFLPLLKRALNKDISFYADERSRRTLLHFLASQHMRTKGIKEGVIEILKRKMGLDVSRTWTVMSHMHAVEISLSIYLEKKKRPLALVENTTGVAFITGDQPLINLQGGDGEKSPTALSWYYPISPHLALLLPEVDEEQAVSTTSLTSAQVSDLNARMVAASHRQVFAQSQSEFEPYVEIRSPR